MEFDRLGEVWRRAGGAPPGGGPSNDLNAARARAERLQRTVRRRDLAESLTALLLAALFGWMAVTAATALSRLGAAVIAVSGVLIPVRLWLARRHAPPPGLPVREAVASELARIRAQQRLLASVAWWYLTPLGAGVLLFMAGVPVPAAVKAGYAAAVIVIYAWIFRLNQRAVRRDLEPVARGLEAWLADADRAEHDEHEPEMDRRTR